MLKINFIKKELTMIRLANKVRFLATILFIILITGQSWLAVISLDDNRFISYILFNVYCIVMITGVVSIRHGWLGAFRYNFLQPARLLALVLLAPTILFVILLSLLICIINKPFLDRIIEALNYADQQN